MKTIITLIICLSSVLTITQNSLASCDCSLKEKNLPCRGYSITVPVEASGISGKHSRDAVFHWEFNSEGEEPYCGQFANGDYWISPSSNNSIEVTLVNGNGLVSLDSNPVIESTGLLDETNNYGNSNKSENLIDSLPLSFSGPVSLVAAMKRDEAISGKCGTYAIEGNCVDAYHVVTILPQVPDEAGSTMLRPNITGEIKKTLFLDDFDLTRLPRKDFFAGATEEGYEKIRERWSHNTEIFGSYSTTEHRYFSEGGRAYRAHILVDEYGAGCARQWYSDMTVMFSADSLRKKRKALAAMLSYGLDIYSSMYSDLNSKNRTWGSGATQHAGRFIPAAFFASLVKDQSYAEKLKKASSHVYDFKDAGPAELAQVQLGKNGPIWGDILFGNDEVKAYWANLFKAQCYRNAPGKCNPNVNAKSGRDPYGYIDGPAPMPGTSYMLTSAGSQRALVAIMVLMPEIGRIVNFPALIEYVDRLDRKGVHTLPDPCAAPDVRENPACDPWNGGMNCEFYGKTWGPDPHVQTQCIKDNKGRFPRRHGENVGYGYTVKEIEDNWHIIREKINLWKKRQQKH